MSPNRTRCYHIWGQNLDFSGFAPLLHDVYRLSCNAAGNSSLAQRLPFPIFQHTMVEYLNAYLLHLHTFANGDEQLGALPHPLHAIDARHHQLPRPIHAYITTIGTAVAPNGAGKVRINLPAAAIPCGPLAADQAAQQVLSASSKQPTKGGKIAKPAVVAVAGATSGTFGVPTAANHNAYECYWSPYVTQQLIQRTGQLSGNWMPFPAGWTPAGCVVNENLLGYQQLKPLEAPEALAALQRCTFRNDDSVLGRLCHSPECLEMTTAALKAAGNVDIVPAVFDYRGEDEATAAAAFVFSEKENELDETLMSPFEFDGNAANLANCFGLKRRRRAEWPGVMLSQANGTVPADWVATRNDNFNMVGAFEPRNCLKDCVGLREPCHKYFGGRHIGYQYLTQIF